MVDSESLQNPALRLYLAVSSKLTKVEPEFKIRNEKNFISTYYFDFNKLQIF
jgi:hypothetical protein